METGAFIGIKPGCGSNMSELLIFLVLGRFFKFIQVSHERDRRWVSFWPWGPILGILCLWRVWKLWHLTPAPLKFPAQLCLCRGGEQLQWGQSFACCLQDMRSALWTVTVVWGGQTLFTAGLWPFILSVLSFSHSCGELGQFCGWPGDPSSSLWECE